MFEYASIHNTCKLHDMLDSNVMKTHFRRKNMYIPYTCHELLYTCHSLAYPVKHQPYFESIFPYFWGSLRYLDLIGSTSQTHCMVFRSLNLINHCLDSDLRIMGISRYMISMYCHIRRIYLYILGTSTVKRFLYFESGFVGLATPTVLSSTLLACFVRCDLPLECLLNAQTTQAGLATSKSHIG